LIYLFLNPSVFSKTPFGWEKGINSGDYFRRKEIRFLL
jgi:hypothetical protein